MWKRLSQKRELEFIPILELDDEITRIICDVIGHINRNTVLAFVHPPPILFRSFVADYS